MRGVRARALVRRLVATTVVVAAILSVGASPAQSRPPLPYVTYSLSDSFDNPALWSNDFGAPMYPCSWGVVSTVASLARTPTNSGSLSTCTGGLGSIGRYVTIPAGSDQCVVRVWRKAADFDPVTKRNTIHIDVIEPSTWFVQAQQIAVANLNTDNGQWRQHSTPFFTVSPWALPHTFFVRFLQAGTGSSQILHSRLDDMTLVCY